MQKKKRKGLLITFEGPDGSGKTTVALKIAEWLQKKIDGRGPTKIFYTREPGGKNNVIAEDIRNILLNKIEYNITPMVETLLFAASRAQHVHDFIEPHLFKNHIVLCDRFIHSSIVYQGIGRNIGINIVKAINQFATNGIEPDITFVLMLKPTIGLKRIMNNTSREQNRLDKEKLALHNLVYQGYKKLIKKYPKKMIPINANQSINDVLKDIKPYIEKLIQQKKYHG